jgi:hypothetical protein
MPPIAHSTGLRAGPSRVHLERHRQAGTAKRFGSTAAPALVTFADRRRIPAGAGRARTKGPKCRERRIRPRSALVWVLPRAARTPCRRSPAVRSVRGGPEPSAAGVLNPGMDPTPATARARPGLGLGVPQADRRGDAWLVDSTSDNDAAGRAVEFEDPCPTEEPLWAERLVDPPEPLIPDGVEVHPAGGPPLHRGIGISGVGDARLRPGQMVPHGQRGCCKQALRVPRAVTSSGTRAAAPPPGGDDDPGRR